jgi:hypothetical protein
LEEKGKGAWVDEVVLERLGDFLRRSPGGAEGEKMVWAFERAFGVAGVDRELLGHLLAATVCLLAADEGSTPRTVLEAFFRRSVSDSQWREMYEPLFG